jgi:hypothetical protein
LTFLLSKAPGVDSQFSAVDLALRLTLLDLLLRPVGDWAVRPMVMSLALIGLLSVTWLRRPILWFSLVALLAVRVVVDWPLADNHAYLLIYWCLAVGIACVFSDRQMLAVNARLLIGLVFGFACVWKFVASPNYLDASFFKFIFIVDPRFEGFVQMMTNLDLAELERLRSHVEAHRDGNFPIADSPVIPAALILLANAATAWNLLINAALAGTFLLPLGEKISSIRHGLLLVYCTVTYAIATVDGFGWLLLAMGCALCSAAQQRWRSAYAGVFVLIVFYREVPWAQLLLG